MIWALIFTPIPIASVFGIGLFVIAVFRFLENLGRKIEIRDIIILMALLQWVIAPVIAYSMPESSLSFYFMAVDHTTYMNYVLPATLAFIAGLMIPVFRRAVDDGELLERNIELTRNFPHLGLVFILIGISANLFDQFFPSALRFAFYLLHNLVFIGLFYILVSDRPYKWLAFIAAILYLLGTSVSTGMFHDLILWMSFMFIIVAYVLRFSFGTKILISASAFIFVILIQAIKADYRLLMAEMNPNSTSKEIVFTSLLLDKITDPTQLVTPENMAGTVIRFNQGWIVARIMDFTPSREPFARGETIYEALRASVFPRIILPQKAEAGGHTYFERFTGKPLGGGTSMNLSLVGEGYANFGAGGGIAFMFVVGLFYNWGLALIFRLARKYPSLIFWIPLIFLQVIKAETDLITVLNHLVKASIVTAGVFWGFRRILGIPI